LGGSEEEVCVARILEGVRTALRPAVERVVSISKGDKSTG
jgi:hypothetical protein